MVKLSVVIPIYNAQSSLKECLDSVMKSDLEDIEVILVDDGSTDASYSVCQKYLQKDDRFKLYKQKNKGAGAARNLGLKKATGKYLHFLDADDYISPRLYKNAFALLEHKDLDFLTFFTASVDYQTGDISPQDFTINKNLLPNIDVFSYKDVELDIFALFVNWVWNKIFKTEFIKGNNIHFLENITSSEDKYFSHLALVNAKRISILVDEAYLFYRDGNPNSLDGNRSNYPLNIYQTLLSVKGYLEENGYFPELERDFINHALHEVLFFLFTTKGYGFDDFWNFLQREGFSNLGILDKDKSYFYDQNEHVFLTDKLLGKSIRDYFVGEIEARDGLLKEQNDSLRDKDEKIYKLTVENKRLDERIRAIENSRSYKIGRAVTYPIRLLKK